MRRYFPVENCPLCCPKINIIKYPSFASNKRRTYIFPNDLHSKWKWDRNRSSLFFFSLVYKMRCSTEIIFCYLMPGSICEMNKHQWHLNRIFSTLHTQKLHRWIQIRWIYIPELCKNQWLQRNWPWLAHPWKKSSKFNSFLVESHICCCCCLRSFTPCICFILSRMERKRPCNLFICKISYVITIKTIFGREMDREWKWIWGKKAANVENTGKECLFVKRNKMHRSMRKGCIWIL